MSVAPHSRGVISPELSKKDPPLRRGRREHRVFQPHPWPRVQQRKHTSSSPQVQPLHRRSLRDGVNAYIRALPGVRDLIVTVTCDTSRRLSASPGAPGPHDFAVRLSRARRTRSCVHRIPLPTFVTMRNAPLAEAGRGYDKQKFLENARGKSWSQDRQLNNLKPF